MIQSGDAMCGLAIHLGEKKSDQLENYPQFAHILF